MSEDRSNYDVIIIGGGPAGSTAGYLLSNFGLNVLLIDKSKFPRKKLCGGLVTIKTLKLLDRIFSETKSSLTKKNILNFESNHYEIFYKNRCITGKFSHIPFHFVDRKVYDNFLLEKAKKAGVEVIEGVEVQTVNLSTNEVFTSKKKTFKGKFIIGADGANSIIRRELFLNGKIDAKNWQNDLSTALEIFVDRNEMKENIDHPIIYFGFVKTGYAWLFPNKDKILLGLGGLNKKNKNNFLKLFHNFLSIFNLNQEKIIKINGHPVPAGGFLKKPIYKNFILIGDAAGLPDPIVGEGIFYAQRSAELASWSIYRSLHDNENMGITYMQLLRKHIFPELIYAMKTRLFIFNVFDKFNYYPMKLLLKVMDRKFIEVIHGIRSYKGFRKKDGLHEGI